MLFRVMLQEVTKEMLKSPVNDLVKTQTVQPAATVDVVQYSSFSTAAIWHQEC